MEEKKESKDIKIKKAILEALEDKPKFPFGSLIGGFLAICMATTCLNITLNSLEGAKLK